MLELKAFKLQGGLEAKVTEIFDQKEKHMDFIYK